MKNLILLFGVIMMTVTVGFSQEEEQETTEILALSNEPAFAFPERYKMIGLNMTPLLTQLIPFNRSNPNVAGPYMMTYRSYRNNNAFRFGLGANISVDAIDNNNASFNLRMGWERKKSFYENWSYSFGFDFFISGGGFNIVNGGNNEDGTFGAGLVWGIEYFLNPKVSLNIESAFYFGAAVDEGANIIFIPPVGLNLNFLVPKRTRKKR